MQKGNADGLSKREREVMVTVGVADSASLGSWKGHLGAMLQSVVWPRMCVARWGRVALRRRQSRPRRVVPVEDSVIGEVAGMG